MTARQNVWMRPERPARGPRPSFSRARLTEAAVRIADAEGLEAITMRRVAAEIGAGTMSLYRYIDGKDDLIELMIDSVALEYIPDDVAPSGDWRTDLRGLAERSRATMLRHPWLAPLAAGRQGAGPNRIRLMERTLSMVDGLGLSIDRMLTLVGAVAGYVNGFVQSELAEFEARRRTKLDFQEWMALQAPYIMSVIQSGDYPLFTRMTAEGGRELTDPDERFAFGLELLLDGIAGSLPPTPGH